MVMRLLVLFTVAGALGIALRYVPFYLPSYGFYTALIVAAITVVALLHPLPALWLFTRSTAAVVFAVAIALAGLMLILPATPTQSKGGMLLDRYLPDYQFVERHALKVPAPPAETWQTVRDLRFADVPAISSLMRIRLAAAGQFHPHRLPGGERILEGLTRPGSGFILLEEKAGEEMVLGMAGRPWARRTPSASVDAPSFLRYSEPGSVRIAFNLRVSAESGGTLLSTETRIGGTDPEGVRIFRRYWCAVYPGSSIMRRAWLSAVAGRAIAGSRALPH